MQRNYFHATPPLPNSFKRFCFLMLDFPFSRRSSLRCLWDWSTGSLTHLSCLLTLFAHSLAPDIHSSSHWQQLWACLYVKLNNAFLLQTSPSQDTRISSHPAKSKDEVIIVIFLFLFPLPFPRLFLFLFPYSSRFLVLPFISLLFLSFVFFFFLYSTYFPVTLLQPIHNGLKLEIDAFI